MLSNKFGFSVLGWIITVFFILVLVVLGWWAWREFYDDSVDINSFEECEQAGYLVMETFPRQCRGPDGRLHVEEVNEDEIDNGYREYNSRNGEVVRIRQPQSGDVVSSPLLVSGEVRGSWSFEADFPVELVDADGVSVATAIGTLRGDWMTEDYVPFEAVLEFSDAQVSGEGVLILRRDNPSGLSEHDDEVEIPVRFE